MFDFSIDDFNCDYYGSSLHKWLATPLGAGLLYVNKNKTHRIWPLLANGNTDKTDIRRLNHIGTSSCSYKILRYLILLII